MLLGRASEGSQEVGADSQCHAFHICQGSSWLGVELQAWKIHGGVQQSVVADTYTYSATCIEHCSLRILSTQSAMCVNILHAASGIYVLSQIC